MTTEVKGMSEVMAKIDFAKIDALITAKQCKVSTLAPELGIQIPILRMAMEEHYGNKVVFKRGRAGGVYWSTDTQTLV